jgi:phosphoribosylglycinamide formyltransferase-1
MSRKRVAILISGRGSNMNALIAAAKAPDYPAEIALVLANRSDAGGLAAAKAAGIATAIVDHRRYGEDRAAFEAAIQQLLRDHRIDLVCLAGFMRLLTPHFVDQWQGRMINIHPSLLPALKGVNTHERALAAKTKMHGASVHFVTADMDSGPVIIQGAVPVLEGDTAESLAERVLRMEHQIYPVALRLLAEGRVRVVDGRCQIDAAASGH